MKELPDAPVVLRHRHVFFRHAYMPPPLDIIAIDNLPSLLPREASIAFSADLMPHLASLGSSARHWQRCLRSFHTACHHAGLDSTGDRAALA